MDKCGTIDRRSLVLGTAAAASALMVGRAFAQDYPARPITVINPFPPGGAADVVMRPSRPPSSRSSSRRW